MRRTQPPSRTRSRAPALCRILHEALTPALCGGILTPPLSRAGAASRQKEMAIRLAMAITAGWLVLRSRDVLKLWFLIPLRDLYGAAVWAVALAGDAVEWGGETLKLDRNGRILR